MKPLARGFLIAYIIDCIVQLGALAVGNLTVAHLSKPLLLPLLMAVVIAQGGLRTHPSIPWLVAGQFFSFLGDVALIPDGQLWFSAGIGMFLVTHICYIVGFFKLGARQGLRDRRWVLVVYPAFWLIANAALWSGLGPMRLPIAIYSAALVTMALCSMSLGTMLGIGGTLFMFSDLLIGEGVAYGSFTGSTVLIMLTYTVGQGLIALAWLQRIDGAAAGKQPNRADRPSVPA